MAAKRRGRPKGSTSAPPSITVSARLTVEQRAALTALQLSGGWTVAEVIAAGMRVLQAARSRG